MDTQTQQSSQPVSAGKRFLNFLIDSVLYLLVSVSCGFVAGLILGFAGGDEALQDTSVLGYVIAITAYFVYYIGFEGLLQRTPGKLITGTKVVTVDGQKPSFGTIVLRTLSRWVPFEVISMYTGKDADKKGTWWHDRWTGTRVVRA